MQRTGMLVGVVVAYLAAGAGCYQPELRDCTVRCTGATDCAGGQVCSKGGWCAMPGIAECPKPDHGDNDSTVDAAVTSPDAPASTSLCEQGCTNGSCADGVCVIDCGAPYACANDVMCPPNVPCRVVCGEHACAKKINCGMASSCEVQCAGDFACGDEIQCNATRCEVACTGASSCERRTRCGKACACDVTCSGIGSCAEPAECPAQSCKLGNGCSSQLGGCDHC